jgi:hypothetical protein
MDIKRSSGPVALTSVEPIASKVNEAWQIYEDALVPYSLCEMFGTWREVCGIVCLRGQSHEQRRGGWSLQGHS